MIYRNPRLDEKSAYEKLAQHPLQSYAWGEFRETTGVEVERLIGFDDNRMQGQMQITIHPLPKVPWTIGYYPKGEWPDAVAMKALQEVGQRHKAIFIKLEPDVSAPPRSNNELDELREFLKNHDCQPGRALFTPHTFLIDLTKSEDELMEQMKSKTRYNVRLAKRKGVEVVEDSTDKGFNDYLELLRLTTKRQQFYAHDRQYQKNMWRFMASAGIAKILKAVYQDKVLVAWILFSYKDVLYYPYGASSREHRDVMASNLMMWEAMKFGKRNGCTHFDLWGSLGPDPDKDDPWYGFHRFKKGYGGQLASFVGTYDLVIDPNLYQLYRIADRWRWRWLRLKSRLPF